LTKLEKYYLINSCNMKLNLKTANQIKQDFQHFIGQKVQTQEGLETIKEIVVLPIVDGSFGTFPYNYLLATDKVNFIAPHKHKIMSLVIYLTDDSYINFFQYLQDNNITVDWSKYIEKR